MSGQNKLAAIPAALIALVALWETCATRRDANAVPDDDAWARAEKVVRAAYRKGDLIVAAPGWEDPVMRLHLGDLLSLDDVARDDDATYARIWELSTRDHHAVTGTVAEEKDDDVTVRRIEQQPVTVVGDVRWQHEPVLAEVGFAPHRCIQVTPAPNAPQTLTFPNLVLGTELVGYVGLADVFTRRDIRAPGHLVVALDGKPLFDVSPGVDDGWVRFAAPTNPGTGTLTVTASATAAQRNICFSITARTPGQPAPR